MSPWLLLPESGTGISPAALDLTYLSRDTCWMILWLFFIPAVAVLFVVVRMASSIGTRSKGVDEGSEMEKGSVNENGKEGVVLRRGSGSGGVWRVE